ncbi:MAG: hypothetical protein EOP05_04880 [Proteobacteria bacterium]|nr:MAG: hypothetical protein EOP05_04880 [Pseudomonadota bacterium]
MELSNDMGEASLAVKGANTGSGNYSLLALRSDESTPKIWQLAHKNSNQLKFEFFNGSSWLEPLVLAANGDVSLGANTSQSSVEINGYLKVSLTSASPPPADCSSADHRGRMKVDAAASILYICMDSGWVAK